MHQSVSKCQAPKRTPCVPGCDLASALGCRHHQAHPTGTARRFLDSEDPHHRCTLVSYSAGISACEKGDQRKRARALLSEMWDAKLVPDVISYSAVIGACEKGAQRQRALALLSEMWDAKLVPDVINYSAETSACEKGAQRQRALALLSEWGAKTNFISYSAGINACTVGEAEAAGGGTRLRARGGALAAGEGPLRSWGPGFLAGRPVAGQTEGRATARGPSAAASIGGLGGAGGGRRRRRRRVARSPRGGRRASGGA